MKIKLSHKDGGLLIVAIEINLALSRRDCALHRTLALAGSRQAAGWELAERKRVEALEDILRRIVAAVA